MFTLFRRSMFVAVAVIGFFLLAPVPILARSLTQTSTPSDFASLLTWLIAGGGASAVVSWLAERSTWFQGLDARAKWVLMVVASCLIAIVAKLLLDFLPAQVFSAIEPYATVIIIIVSTYLTGQAAHGIDKSLTAARVNKSVKQIIDLDVGSSQVKVGGDVESSTILSAGRDAKKG